MDLFEYMRQQNMKDESPLASRLRPTTLDEVVGQQHIVGKDKLLYRAIKADKLSSIIFYGPPGTGKTTLAKVIANTTSAEFMQINATSAGKKDMEEVVAAAKNNQGMYGKKTILFIDEIHRFNKGQQDYLLPFVEDGTIILIGATTENPYFEVNPALLSRSVIFELKKLSTEDIRTLLLRAVNDTEKGMGSYHAQVDDDALEFLADMANGDARAALTAIESGHDLALANKESLVTGGHLVTQAVAKHGVKLLPVDSEHSAIFQCLQDKESAKSLTKILLTASGGPFFGMKTEELRGKTKADALKHPNWNMGAKITIDSATLMNKGLELIEAVWLFGLPPEKIQIVVQRQSVVHSAVQYSDNSIIAQLGVPDMRIPIQYALTYPARVPGVVPELDFTTLKLLTFDVADEETFRCLAACKKAIKKGGLGPCAANGANEEAVKLFLEDKIGFLDIGRLVEAVVDSDRFGGDYTLADVYECDRMARAFVRSHL